MSDQPPQIQRLLPRHFKIIDLAVAGHDTKVIAETVGMSTRAVTTILRSALAQQEIALKRKAQGEAQILGMDRDATRGKAQSILEQASVRAAEKQVDLLQCPDPSIALRAADRILDRVFGKADETKKSLVVNITAQQVELITSALKESDYERHVKPAHGPDSEYSIVAESDVPDILGDQIGPDCFAADGTEDQSSDVCGENTLVPGRQ